MIPNGSGSRNILDKEQKAKKLAFYSGIAETWNAEFAGGAAKENH